MTKIELMDRIRLCRVESQGSTAYFFDKKAGAGVLLKEFLKTYL